MPGPNEANIETVPVEVEPATPKPVERKTEQATPVEVTAREASPVPTMLGPEPPVLIPEKETRGQELATDAKQSVAPTKVTDSSADTPAVVPETSPTVIGSARTNSTLIAWILLGLSALILIIQIWTYVF